MESWYHILAGGKFPDPQSIKNIFASADILPGNRVVFNIKGNSYRIVVQVNYRTQTMLIRFIGTHAEYDKVHAESV